MAESQVTFTFVAVPASAFNVNDGSLELSIANGTAPYNLVLMKGDMVIATASAIPVMDGATPNKILTGLEPGFYSISIADSTTVPTTTENTVPMEIKSPPYVTLKGNFNAHGAVATVKFVVGETEYYGFDVDLVPEINNDAETHSIEKQLSGGNYDQYSILEPGKTYHYQTVVTNSSGTARGIDKTFSIPGSLPEAVTVDPTIDSSPAID